MISGLVKSVKKLSYALRILQRTTFEGLLLAVSYMEYAHVMQYFMHMELENKKKFESPSSLWFIKGYKLCKEGALLKDLVLVSSMLNWLDFKSNNRLSRCFVGMIIKLCVVFSI